MITMHQPGKASFILGGQWGSEGKGAASAFLAKELIRQRKWFDVVTTNAGVQSGHTSIHNGRKRVLYHLPTYAAVLHDMADKREIPPPIAPYVYLNAGSIIDPLVLEAELAELPGSVRARLGIHPNAAVVTDECRAAEGSDGSAQTKIASTRKGVGEALSRKVLRCGMVAKDHPFLKQFVGRKDLNQLLQAGMSMLAEIPQGVSLSVNSRFYPFTTSRECTVMQAMADAQIHPQFCGPSMLVLRTYPIRVGNIKDKDGDLIGWSGDAYPGQRELDWKTLGVEPEITTVTKRVRRVFEFSFEQVLDAMRLTRPTHVFLSFCDYFKDEKAGWNVTKMSEAIEAAASTAGMKELPTIYYAFGPTTDDVYPTPTSAVKVTP